MALISVLATSITITGLGPNIAATLREMSGGNLPLLLILAAAACYVFGMGLPTITAYLLVALLIVPAVIQAGVLPLAAHFMVLYLALIGHYTPPVAPASYIAAGIAGSDFMRTGFTAMRLGMALLIVPFFIVYEPSLVMVGDPGTILRVFARSFIGVVLLSAGVSGYLLRFRNVVERVCLVAAGLLMIWPSLVTTVSGIALGMVILIPWSKVLALVSRRVAVGNTGRADGQTTDNKRPQRD